MHKLPKHNFFHANEGHLMQYLTTKQQPWFRIASTSYAGNFQPEIFYLDETSLFS
jgi:hypothetical protein